MPKPVSVIAGMLLAIFGSAVSADCGSDYYTVTVDEASMSVMPKELSVCNGDVVEWRNSGPSDFHVIFAAGGPPGSPQQGDGTYSVTISATPGSYPYDVKIRGMSLDPTIIVNR
ncbi:MAG TPA: hypothetical protein VIS76_17750 [Pseudomonadales bacterium]